MLAPRPRLLLDVAEPDSHGLVLQRVDRKGVASVGAVADARSALTDGRCARARAAEDQGVTVRLGDIKEEARARRQTGGTLFIRAGGQSQRRTVTSWSGSEATGQPW